MAKESKDEEMVVRDEDMRDRGSPAMHQPSVESELPPGMPKPMAPGEMSMGGVRKGMGAGMGDKHMGNSDMGSAVSQLNYETERGEHAPGVGGHADAGMAHHGIMKKA